MAFASSLFTSLPAPNLPSPGDDGPFSARFRPTHLVFPRYRLRPGLSPVACARRRNPDSDTSKMEFMQQFSPKDAEEEEVDDDEEMDDDTFKALFMELENDLENDTSLMDDDEITEEDFVMVQRALAEALRGGGDDIELTNSLVDDDAETGGRDDDEEEDDEEEEIEPGSLKILESLTQKAQ